MKRKIVKAIITIILTAVLEVNLMTFNVIALGTEDIIPINNKIGVIDINNNASKEMNIIVEDLENTEAGVVSSELSVCPISSSLLRVYGSTLASDVVYEVGFVMNVEEFVNGDWTNYAYVSQYENYDYYANKVVYLNVQPNNYYRVYSVHYILDGGEYVIEDMYSDVIYME